MSEEELKSRWMAAILDFDWSKEKGDQDNNNETDNKEILA